MLVLELEAMVPSPAPPPPNRLLEPPALPKMLLAGCCDEFMVEFVVLLAVLLVLLFWDALKDSKTSVQSSHSLTSCSRPHLRSLRVEA